MQKITIVIVHWNTPESLKKQIDKLSSSQDIQIVVVDNHSQKSLSWLKARSPSVTLIENEINRGYAFACNQGAAIAEGKWLLFLNPDVEIDPGQVFQLIDLACNEDLLAASPVPGSDDYRKPIPTLLSLLAEFSPLGKILPKKNVSDPKTLTGGCLLIKSKLLKKLGGWDERFFLWFEDSDLTLRLLKNGYKIGWLPIDVKHAGGTTFSMLDDQFKRDIFFSSMDVFAKKHFSLIGQFVVQVIKNHYTKRKLLPRLDNTTNITLPNLEQDLLHSFFEQNKHLLFSTPGVEWIVVTSGMKSTDFFTWKKEFPLIRLIPIERNRGFASTVNIGFHASAGRWVGTVNDDVKLTQDWLVRLLSCVDTETGSINPLIYKEDNTIESSGITILKKGKAIPLTSATSREVDATNAAAVLYNKEVLNKVGLFDEKFGSYLEDIDLSLRIKRAGYKNIICPEAKVVHAGQSTSKHIGSKKNVYDFRNWIFVIIKNWTLQDLVLNFPAIFLERLRNLSGISKSL